MSAASDLSFAGLTVDMVVSNDISFLRHITRQIKTKPRTENVIHLLRLENREKRRKDQGLQPLISRQDDVFALIG